MSLSTSGAVPYRAGDEMVARYTLAERINHWIGAAAYVYALITGLAFWSPYFYWLAAIVGGWPSGTTLAPLAGYRFRGIPLLDVQGVVWRHAN